MFDKPEPSTERSNATSERLFADSQPTSFNNSQNRRAEEPNQMVFDNGPYPASSIDHPPASVGASHTKSVVETDGLGRVSAVVLNGRTLVDFDPKTGKPSDVFSPSDHPGVMSTYVQLDPKTGKPADVRVTSSTGHDSYFAIDPISGKATPEKSMKH